MLRPLDSFSRAMKVKSNAGNVFELLLKRASAGPPPSPQMCRTEKNQNSGVQYIYEIILKQIPLKLIFQSPFCPLDLQTFEHQGIPYYYN